LCTEARNSQSGGPNVRAAAAGAKIQGYAYDADFAVNNFFHHVCSVFSLMIEWGEHLKSPWLDKANHHQEHTLDSNTNPLIFHT
jgi:hypothetical protein